MIAGAVLHTALLTVLALFLGTLDGPSAAAIGSLGLWIVVEARAQTHTDRSQDGPSTLLGLSLCTVVLWGSMPIVLKGVLGGLDPLTLTWTRFSIIALLMASFLAWRGGYRSLLSLRGTPLLLLGLATAVTAGPPPRPSSTSPGSSGGGTSRSLLSTRPTSSFRLRSPAFSGRATGSSSSGT